MDFGNFFTGGPVQNQNDLMRRQYLAQALLGQANAPGQHPIAALIGNVLGTMRMRKLGREEDRIEADKLAQRERFNKALGEALAGGDRSQIAQALLSSGDPTFVAKALDLSLNQDDPLQVVGGAIYDKSKNQWITPPATPSMLSEQEQRDAALVKAGLRPKAINPKAATGSASTVTSKADERRRLGEQYGLSGDALQQFTLTGKIPEPPKVDPKEERARKKEDARLQAGLAGADIVTSKVDEALGIIDAGILPRTGLIGAAMGKIPGSPAYDLDRTIDTIKAQVGFRELQAMREASPTGGALGQVAVRELDMLQATIASLDAGQSREQLENNLRKVKKHYENWKNAVSASRGGVGGGGAEGWSIEEVQ